LEKNWEGETQTTVDSFVRRLEKGKYLGNGNVDRDLLERGIATLLQYPSSHFLTGANQVAAKKVTISFYQFSTLIDWFGPLKGNANASPMVTHMMSLFLHDWFFGPCEKIESDNHVKRFKNSNCFLLRLNTGGSIPIDKAPFCITKESSGESVHVRVYPNGGYGKWVCKLPTGEKIKGDNLEQLIQNMKNFDGYIKNPVEGCLFKQLTQVNQNHGAYATDTEMYGDLDKL